MAKCEPENLREIQKQNWKLLHDERQNVQHLLNLLLPQGRVSNKEDAHVDSSLQSKIISSKMKSTSKPPAASVQSVAPKTLTASQDKINDDAPQLCKNKPFPFLKKGVGLIKYKGLSKSGALREEPSVKKSANSSQPAKTTRPKQSLKELKFKRVTFQENTGTKAIEPCTSNFVTRNSERNTDIPVFDNATEPKELVQSESPMISQDGDAEELVEFEILEKVTHNCSLDSDSSFVNCLLNSRVNTRSKELDTHGHQLNTPEVELGTSQLAPAEASITCSPIFNASLMGRSENTEVEEFPLPVAICKSVFEDEHSWKDTNALDFSDDSSSDDVMNKESSSKQLSCAFEEARTELLRVPAQVPDEERLLLQGRLKELEEEIKNFRKENAFLAKLKSEHEQAKKELEKERILVKRLQEEQREGHELLKEEKKKLKKQQQVFETHWKARQQNPDKKEREEIAALKSEIQKLQEEVKKQRVQWLAECGRLRTNLASVEFEKEKLQVQVQKLQQEKVQLAQIRETNAQSTNKEKEATVVKHTKKPLSKSVVKKTSAKISTNGVSSKVAVNNVKTKKDVTKKLDDEKPKQKIADFVQSYEPIKNTETFGQEMEKKENDNDSDEVVEIIEHTDKVEKILRSGEHELLYSSGTRKIISSDLLSSQIFFYNGDVMMTLPDKTEIYYYSASGTKQTRYAEGTVLLEYADGREEKSYKDGMKQLKYQDGTTHVTFPDATQEIRSPDGTVLKIQSNGEELIEFTNGERELRTMEFKRREYSNGSSKTVYNDGRQETQYPDGRIRLKDKNGIILTETKCTV